MAPMLVLGKSGKARHLCADKWCAGCAKQMHLKNRSGLVQIFTKLQKLQCLFMGVPDKLWRQNYCHKEKSRSIASSTDRHSSRACDVETQR